MTEWTKKNQQAATSQGWLIYDSKVVGEGPKIIRGDDKATRFPNDPSAQAFVAWKALQGDKLAYTAVNYLAEKHGIKDQDKSP